jgi:type II secretory pathway pseudopilin PulG
MRPRDQSRGISPAITHVLTVSISAMLITALLLSASGLFREQRERVARQQLNDIGGQLSSQLDRVDRLSQSGTNVSATMRTNYPSSVAGRPYTMWLTSQGDTGLLYLNASSLGVQVRIAVANQTRIEPQRVTGEDIRVITEHSAAGQYITIRN